MFLLLLLLLWSGRDVKTPGERCGSGLSAKAAGELGLVQGIPVATSIIDAHAGGLGKFALGTYLLE